MNTALLYFTLHLVEVQIDHQLDAPYVEKCIEYEPYSSEFICLKDFIED